MVSARLNLGRTSRPALAFARTNRWWLRGLSVQVRAIGGDTLLAPIATNAITRHQLPGLGGTAHWKQCEVAQPARLPFRIAEYRESVLLSPCAGDTTWKDFRIAVENPGLDYHQNSYDFFVKDDWKIQKNLTLNLGLRYEKYGVPFIAHGLTVAPGRWWVRVLRHFRPRWFLRLDESGTIGERSEFADDTSICRTGLANANTTVWRDDRNNFGPAVGFAWQVPFFGEGKTTVRGGYQITYQGTVQVNSLDSAIGNSPGTTNKQTFGGDASNPYLDLATALTTVFRCR